MIGTGPDVGSVATIALDAVVAHFDAADHPLPERRYLAAGDTRMQAWDTDAVIVTAPTIGWGAGPGTGSQSGVRTGTPLSVTTMRHAVIGVHIVRPNPEYDPDHDTPLPGPEEITAAALVLMRDAGLLAQALADLAGPSGPFGRGGVSFNTVAMLGPEGAYAAVEGLLTVTLGGSV